MKDEMKPEMPAKEEIPVKVEVAKGACSLRIEDILRSLGLGSGTGTRGG